MIARFRQFGENRSYDVLGFTYDPDTGKGYDIEGALVFDNGRYMPNAGYQPIGPAVPLVIDPATAAEEKRLLELESKLSNKTILFIVFGAVLFLIAIKK